MSAPLPHRLVIDAGVWPLQLYVRAEGRGSWQAATAATGKVEYGAGDVPRLYVQNVGEGKHRQLADFGEHLEDLSRDWTNRDLGL